MGNLRSVLSGIELIHGDFMDDAVLKQALQGVETVFHLVTTTFPNMQIESGNYDLLSNLLPTIRLLELARESGHVRRLVYASSGGTIYGEPQFLPISEDHPREPKSAYGQSKLTIENYLSFYARTTPLDISILRLSNPYGPGQNTLGTQGLIAVAMGCALDNRPLKVFGDGQSMRDYIYIDDVIEALIKTCSIAPVLANVSSGVGHNVHDIIAAVEAACGRTIVKDQIPARPGDVSVNILDNSRAIEKLQWAPRMGLHAGIEKTWQSLM